MTEARKPDVILRCDHGRRGGHADLVQRYRWMVEQDEWVPTIRHNVVETELDGDQPVDFWTPGQHRRARENRCLKCPDAVPVSDNDKLQTLFAMLTGQSMRMRELRTAFAMHVTENPPAVTLTLAALRSALTFYNRQMGTAK